MSLITNLSHIRKINIWFFVTFIGIISVLGWFITDLKKTEKIQVISQVEEEIAKPLNKEYDVDFLNKLNNRLNISENELLQVKVYAQTEQGENTTKKTITN